MHQHPWWDPNGPSLEQHFANRWTARCQEWTESCNQRTHRTEGKPPLHKSELSMFPVRISVVPIEDREKNLLFGRDYEFDGYDLRGKPRWRSQNDCVIELRELVGWVLASTDVVVKNRGNPFAPWPHYAQWEGWRVWSEPVKKEESPRVYAQLKNHSASIAPEMKLKRHFVASDNEMISSFGGNPRIFARFGGHRKENALLPSGDELGIYIEGKAPKADGGKALKADRVASLEDRNKLMLNASRYQIVKESFGNNDTKTTPQSFLVDDIRRLQAPVISTPEFEGLTPYAYPGDHLQRGNNPALLRSRDIQDLSKDLITSSLAHSCHVVSEPRALAVLQA